MKLFRSFIRLWFIWFGFSWECKWYPWYRRTFDNFLLFQFIVKSFWYSVCVHQLLFFHFPSIFWVRKFANGIIIMWIYVEKKKARAKKKKRVVRFSHLNWCWCASSYSLYSVGVDMVLHGVFFFIFTFPLSVISASLI